MTQGVAKFSLDVDASGYNAGIDTAARKTAELGKTGALATADIAKSLNEAEKAARKLSDTEERAAERRKIRAVSSIERQLAGLSEGPAGLTAFDLGRANLDSKAIENYVDRMKAATAINTQFAMSARATGYAMTLIPAQMTDIVTQLAGGQSPFLILIQQGGQLKDMFGGVVPALQAVTGYIAGMVNPFTIAAAAVAALGYAFYVGSQQLGEFNKSLILTGNYAGVTGTQLVGMAQNISVSVGTVGQAGDALNALVASGRYTADQLGLAGEATLRFSKATGESIKDVAAEFSKITDDPVKGLEQLNEKYNFLTSTVYNHVKSLVEQGDKQQAVTVALEAFSAATDSMARDVVKSMGYVERAWVAVRDTVIATGSAIAGIGRVNSLQDMQKSLADVDAKLKAIDDRRAKGKPEYADKGLIAPLQKERLNILSDIALAEQAMADAAEKAATQRFENDKMAAEKSNDALRKSAWTKEQIRADEIAKTEQQYRTGAINRERYLAGIEAINERYKDPQGKAYTDDAATRMLQTLRDQAASMSVQTVVSDKLTASEKKRVEFNQMLSDLKGKNQLTADQESLLAARDQINAQFDINIAYEKRIRLQDDINKVTQKQADLQATINESSASRFDQYQNQLAASVMGDQALQRMKEEANIRKEFQKYQDQLAKGLSQGAINSDEFRAAQDSINAELQKSLRAFRDYYADLDSLNSKWITGVRQGAANYADTSANVARSVNDVFVRSMTGIEDAFISMLNTGSASFTALANSIINDLARIAIRSSITGPLSSAIGSAITGAIGGFAGGGAQYGSPDVAQAMFGGGRASGGPVNAGMYYQVAENGPEVYSSGGKTYLLSGKGSGYVTPLDQSAQGGAALGGGGVTVNVINQSRQPLQAEASAPRFDGTKMVQDIVLSDLRRNGPIGQALRSGI